MKKHPVRRSTAKTGITIFASAAAMFATFFSASADKGRLNDSFAFPASASAPSTQVSWTSGDNLSDTTGAHYVQRITVKGDQSFDRLGFNMFARRMKPLDSRDTVTEIVPGYYTLSSSRFGKGADSVVVEIDTRGRLINGNYAPDGFHRINPDGTTDAVAYRRLPIDRRGQWQYAGKDDMPYGPQVYDFNERVRTDWTPGPYDIIPSYKSVRLTGGESTIRHLAFAPQPTDDPTAYRITVSGDSVIVACAPELQWAVYVPFQTKVMGGRDKGVVLPNAIIDDKPDFPWRGLMIDIARNYQTPATMQGILRLMVANRLNRLHFHFADDEAWRLEIPGLPELTEVGARRGYTTDEHEHLVQIFAGDGNPDTKTGTANGYFTRKDFIDLIKTAHVFGIEVIPEIEMPGHARAAIKAMEKRHRRGDDRYRLIEDGDTSRYTSAQSFHDNVMNPALEGPYRFVDKVTDEIIKMYREAEVPLPAIHIGGDEVPRGAWAGSPSARALMKKKGFDSQTQLHAAFVRRISDMLADKGVKISGWQEIALGHDDAYNDAVRPNVYSVNCWSTLSSHNNNGVTDRSVRAGYPTVLSNVNHLYFDLSYSAHPEEKGLTWGGHVDEYSSFNAYRSKLCPASDSVGGVIGLNGHVFAETMRSPQQLYTYLIPKIFGLAERAWNSGPTYTEAQYTAIIGERELPMFSSVKGMAVHMRQPGIKIIDGLVHMNSPYRGGEIRYTTDGTMPDASSPVYTAPFALPAGTAVIKAVLIRNNAVSVPTYLFLD